MGARGLQRAFWAKPLSETASWPKVRIGNVLYDLSAKGLMDKKPHF